VFEQALYAGDAIGIHRRSSRMEFYKNWQGNKELD
jgi:hypothetical protein